MPTGVDGAAGGAAGGSAGGAMAGGAAGGVTAGGSSGGATAGGSAGGELGGGSAGGATAGGSAGGATAGGSAGGEMGGGSAGGATAGGSAGGATAGGSAGGEMAGGSAGGATAGGSAGGATAGGSAGGAMAGGSAGGGSADGGVADAGTGSCNAVAYGAPGIPFRLVASFPAATGGTIVPGTYDAIDAQTTDPSVNWTFRGTYVFEASGTLNTLEQLSRIGVPTAIVRRAWTWSVSGTSLIEVPTCGFSGGPLAVPYSVRIDGGTFIDLRANSAATLYTYRRR
ncbi:MAG: hypothetical protein SFW67_32920 [Myxococcaceae bacterium]|nr:hypothetical protein [Myxococcaceae bacterium]